LQEFLIRARQEGKTVYGLGASTKGNVLLQYCGVTKIEVAAIAEVNPDKYSCMTPGTSLPILPQDQVLAEHPDYLLVLPWHYREFFLNNPRFSGRQLVFPLPKLEIVIP
jgi:NDP-4-keto-2,6-dideoxyhexose 3-C-methyltransferase